MSTTLSAMTAAELVAELERRQADRPKVTLQNIDPWFIHAGEGVAEAKIAENERNWIESMSDITAELDARCETFEISLFERAGMVQFKYGQFMQKEGIGAWLNISATEQHALESYLLTKGGDK